MTPKLNFPSVFFGRENFWPCWSCVQIVATSTKFIFQNYENGVRWIWSMQSLLRSTLSWQENVPEWCSVKLRCAIPVDVDITITGKCTGMVFWEVEVRNPCWGRLSHDRKTHQNGVLWHKGAQSTLRSTNCWQENAPEWCSVDLKYAISVEIACRKTKQSARAVFCEFEITNPCWGRYS